MEGVDRPDCRRDRSGALDYSLDPEEVVGEDVEKR